jgi:hypothetical protein
MILDIVEWDNKGGLLTDDLQIGRNNIMFENLTTEPD